MTMTVEVPEIVSCNPEEFILIRSEKGKGKQMVRSCPLSAVSIFFYFPTEFNDC